MKPIAMAAELTYSINNHEEVRRITGGTNNE